MTPNEQKIMGMLREYLDMASALSGVLSDQTGQVLQARCVERHIAPFGELSKMRNVLDELISQDAGQFQGEQ